MVTRAPARAANRGFTLVELLVVLAIIALLMSITLPRYFHAIDAAREQVLAENLHATRDAIDKFYGDTGRYPDSLDELVARHYLRSAPVDPVTGSTTTWILVAPDPAFPGNVYDLKSGAPGAARDGRAFADL